MPAAVSSAQCTEEGIVFAGGQRWKGGEGPGPKFSSLVTHPLCPARNKRGVGDRRCCHLSGHVSPLQSPIP